MSTHPLFLPLLPATDPALPPCAPSLRSFKGCERGCTCSCGGGSTVGLFILAGTMALSLLLLILSGTLGGSWVPMINLISVFFLPVYAVLSRQLAPRAAESPGAYNAAATPPFDEGKAIWGNFGVCFLGLVLASMVGFPLILLHGGTLCVVGSARKRPRRFSNSTHARAPLPPAPSRASATGWGAPLLRAWAPRLHAFARALPPSPPVCGHLTFPLPPPTDSSALGFTRALRRRRQTATD